MIKYICDRCGKEEPKMNDEFPLSVWGKYELCNECYGLLCAYNTRLISRVEEKIEEFITTKLNEGGKHVVS